LPLCNNPFTRRNGKRTRNADVIANSNPFPRTLYPPATHDYTTSLINATCNYDISVDIESVDNPIIEGFKGGRDFKVEVTETIFPEQKIEKVACNEL